MAATIRTIVIAVGGPPALLFAVAHLAAFLSHAPAAFYLARSPLAGYAALVGAWMVGMVGLLSSGWRRKVVLWAGAVYTLAAVPLIPFAAMFAICSTGDCL